MKLGKFPELAPGHKAEWGFKPRSVNPKPMFLALASVDTRSPLGKMEGSVPTCKDPSPPVETASSDSGSNGLWDPTHSRMK